MMKRLWGDALESSSRAREPWLSSSAPRNGILFCGRLDTNSPRKVLKSSLWGRHSSSLVEGPQEHANVHMSYRCLLVVQLVHAIRNSSKAGRPIAEEARSSGTRNRLDSFAGCARGAACSRSELFAA